PMASALPAGMDEDRVAAMSAALLSLAERAAQGLGRGDLSQVYIEGENGTVFLVSAQDEAVLIAVTAADTKVGMMLYEVKLAANKVGEVLRGPAPLPAPLPSHLTRSYLDEAAAETDSAAYEPAEPASDELPYGEADHSQPSYEQPAYVDPAYEAAVEAAEASEPTHDEPAYSEPVYTSTSNESADVPAESDEDEYAEVAYTSASALTEPYFAEAPATPAPPADPPGWSSYAPSGSVLPGGQGSWS
ncbi:MAG TPA: roadblock/LC7 domain-containing protein, partial [Acidothermaceae bacterium]